MDSITTGEHVRGREYKMGQEARETGKGTCLLFYNHLLMINKDPTRTTLVPFKSSVLHDPITSL
jgi:hypothetical protein